MSAVRFCIAEWLQEKYRLAEMEYFKRDNKLSVFGVLSFYRTKERVNARDLILFGPEEVLKGFIDLNEKTLSLIEITAKYALFKVKDAKYTRKYYQPVLEKYLKDAKLI